MSEPQDENLDPQEQAFAQRLQQRLRLSEGELDEATRMRLAQARRRAVQQVRNPWLSFVASPAGYMAGGVAAAVLVAVMIAPLQRLTDPRLGPMPDLEAEEFVVAQDTELLEELEFMAWVLENENSIDGASL